jgi:hypothetical protein
MRQNPNNLPDRVKGKKPEHSPSHLMSWLDAHLSYVDGHLPMGEGNRLALSLGLLIKEANVLAGKGERLPDFNILGGHKDRGDRAEMVEFESFINQHYPRKKFAELWRRLYQVRLRQALGWKITAPDIFRALFRSHELLQSIVTVGNWVAETSNTKRPALQICAGCGRFFLARRKDAQTCSPKCSARFRMARVRAKRKIYELERQKKLAAKEWDEKLRAIRKKRAAS